MARYHLNFVDIIRGVVVQTNERNNKKRIFRVGSFNGHSAYLPISKEYREVSTIAPQQTYEPYAMFVASTNNDKVIILNTEQKLKISNWQKQIQPINTNRSFHCLQYEIFPEVTDSKKLKVFSQSDDTVLFKHKDFGEVLYNSKNDSLSLTAEYISNPNDKGYRIVCLNADMIADERMAYIDKSFNIVGKPFYKFINNAKINEIAPTLDLVCQKYGDAFAFYFLDENHLPCSKKYDDINTINKQIIATNFNGKQVLLNNLAQEISPHFVNIEKLGNNFILQVDKHLNKCVLFNPNLKQNNVSTLFSKTQVCEKHNILMGDVVVNNQKCCVIINSANPNNAFAVDPCVGLLIMSHLNGKRLNSHLVDKIIDNASLVKQTLNSFNDCLNQSLPKNKQTPITDKQNVCYDFVNKLKKCANHRIRKFKKQSSMLNNESHEIEAQYLGYIEDHQQELAQIELQKQITEAHFQHELTKKEELMELRNQEIEVEQQVLQEQKERMKNLKENLSNIQLGNDEILNLE